jgi:hypothetical protein
MTGQRVKHKRRPFPKPKRGNCYECGLPIPDDEEAIKAKNADVYKHWECWYDGTPFKRDPRTGKVLR